METKGRFPFKWASGKRKESYFPRTIGILGAGRGTGATHFTFMTASYLTGVLRESCAVLEWTDHGDFERVKQLAGCSMKSALFFTLLETDFYPKAGETSLVLCKNRVYDNVIVDYGEWREEVLGEFFRCDRQFVVGSLSEWRLEALTEAAVRRRQGFHWETLTVFGSEEARKNLEKRQRSPVRRVPVSLDVFQITEQIIDFYQQLF